MTDDYLEEPRRPEREPAPRANPAVAGLVGLGVGVVLTAVALFLVGGNPFSDTNEVVFQQVTIAAIDSDRICWSQDPQRRDAPLECAVLALDPALAQPEEGDDVVIGVVDLEGPDVEVRQVVYAAPATGAPAPRESPTTP